MSNDLLDLLERMSPEEREQFGVRMKEHNDSVVAGIKRGDLKCPTCGIAVIVHRKVDLSWTAECRCGWSAAGTGHAPVN